MNLFGRREAEREKWGDRLPPGQKPTDGWPVLHYGSIPKIDLDTWRFEISGLVEEPVSFSWQEFMALPQVNLRNDIHCVTAWSKFDNDWTGVPVSEVLKRVQLKPEARHVMVHSFGGYTTNISLEDLNRPENLFAFQHNGESLTKEHGWPMRLVVPHLYFWKSAKWARGLVILPEERPGFWEMYGYHIRGDPFKEERYS
ncbi:MAG: molybdopterin-dependent oxidoreductase [Dehalococcoidia bacterium]|nr:molybdopterin-dependent oxidoreductase [Dehalococcoidia bacterium]